MSGLTVPTTTIANSVDGPFAALAFKIMTDPFVGSLTFARIYSGKLSSGSSVVNTVKNQKERVGRMLLMHANDREDIKEAVAGDIVALAGLKNTTTGDTLCGPDVGLILERMEFPEPVIKLAVEPKSTADQEKMAGSGDVHRWRCRRDRGRTGGDAYLGLRFGSRSCLR